MRPNGSEGVDMNRKLNTPVRASLVLVLTLLALPMQTSHALRWGGVSNQELVYSYVNDVCRDGMTVVVIRYTNAPSGPPPQSVTIDFQLGDASGHSLTSKLIPVTDLPRPPLWVKIDFLSTLPPPIPPAWNPPYRYYSLQKVLWAQPLDPGAQVVLVQVATSPSSIDPATVSDCLTGERNQTIEQRNALAGLPPTGDKKADRHIGKAVEALNRSLAPDPWQADGLLLTNSGATAFKEFITAVRQLSKIGHPSEAVANAMNALPNVACGLASNAIEAAVLANGDAGAINKAEAALARGLASVAAGDPVGGIRQFKLAWLHAQRAVGRWGDEIDEINESAGQLEESTQAVEP
jgi:hypothetical protein